MSIEWQRFAEFVRDEIVTAVTEFAQQHPDACPRRAVLYDFRTHDLLILFPTIAVCGAEAGDAHPEEWEWQHDSTRSADAWAAVLTAYAGSGSAGWPAVVSGFHAAIAAGCRSAAERLIAHGVVGGEFDADAERPDDTLPACVVGVDDICESTSLDDRFDLLDRIGRVSDEVACELLSLVRDRSWSDVVRGAAASTLAWVGRLDLVVADLSSLTHQQALDVVARPYLGRDKNGPLNYSPLERVLDAHPMLHDELVTRLSPTSMYGIDADDLPAAMSGLSSRWAFVRRHASIVLLSVHV